MYPLRIEGRQLQTNSTEVFQYTHLPYAYDTHLRLIRTQHQDNKLFNRQTQRSEKIGFYLEKLCSPKLHATSYRGFLPFIYTRRLVGHAPCVNCYISFLAFLIHIYILRIMFGGYNSAGQQEQHVSAILLKLRKQKLNNCNLPKDLAIISVSL